jgi:hypothetical protein
MIASNQSTTRLGSWSPAILLAALLSWTFALSIAVLGLFGGLALGTLKPWLHNSLATYNRISKKIVDISTAVRLVTPKIFCSYVKISPSLGAKN